MNYTKHNFWQLASVVETVWERPPPPYIGQLTSLPPSPTFLQILSKSEWVLRAAHHWPGNFHQSG